MLRRLFAFLLVLACAFAPVLPVQSAPETKAADCCCHRKCPCEQNRACAPAPVAAVRAPADATANVEQRVAAAKPKLRVSFAAFARLLFAPEKISAPAVRFAFANAPAPADSVALYEAHCSRLI